MVQISDSTTPYRLKIIQNSNQHIEEYQAEVGLEIQYENHIFPKFQWDLKPIKGIWCSNKRFTRQKSDQTFQMMMQLIPESRENFVQRQIYLKLSRRFWKTIQSYSQGAKYGDVLKLYFSSVCKPDVISHRRISDTKLVPRIHIFHFYE